MTYGADERALKLSGNGDLRFGASPLLRASLSARQLDADKFFAKDNKDASAAEPVRVLPAVRALMSGIPQVADPGADRTRLRAGHAGRPSVAGHRRRTAWRRQILARAQAGVSRAGHDPGLAERGERKSASPDQFKAALNVEFIRSGRIDDLAAGPRRYRLSQPEAVAAARRRHRGA